MSSATTSATSAAPRRDGRVGSDWAGPALRPAGFNAKSILWALIVPPRGYRTLPTISGWVLVLLAFSLGLAAYNTASNILFIALSLLLASLIMSGMLAWSNFRRNRWRLTTAPRFRAGEPALCRIEIVNEKRFLPTYALMFDVRLKESKVETSVPLARRLDVGVTLELPVQITPPRRGVETLELVRVRSLYPFGFLMKILPGGVQRPVWIWPARVNYVRHHPLSPSASAEHGAAQRAGPGTDLLSLRPYRPGDAQRAIHWKASARVQRLLVRQFAADAAAGFRMRIEGQAELWGDPEHFERLCGLAATLAEDLFREGRLVAVAVGSGLWRPVRRLSELEALLDEIATLKPSPPSGEPPAAAGGENVLTFAPAEGRRVHAYVDGELAATA